MFLAQGEPDWRMLHSIYQACVDNSDVEISVVDIGWGTWHGISTYTGPLLEQLAIPFIDGRSDSRVLQDFKPSVILLTSPYDQFRPSDYEAAKLAKIAKLVYLPYGVDFSGATGELALNTFGLATQKLAWRIYTRSSATVPKYCEYAGKSPGEVVPLGLPVFDHFFTSEAFDGVPDDVVVRSRGKFKILYTPHHALECWSTFLNYGPTIRSILQQQEDYFMIFRPHPGLGYSLQAEGLLSIDEFRQYFDSERVYFQDCGEFFGAMRWSDLLVSDASSMLFQYAPTRRPILYTHLNGGWGLDETIRDEVFDSYYVVNDANQIGEHLRLIQGGVDPKRDQRRAAQERIIPKVFAPGAGARIVDSMVRDLRKA